MIEGETIWNSTILLEKTTNQKASWWGEQGTKSTAKKRSSVFMYCLWGDCEEVPVTSSSKFIAGLQ